LREAFSPLMTSDRGDRRIFISRAEEGLPRRRRLLNHEEIESIAKRYDFEIVTPATLSFAEQVALFSGAAVIAGAHGAGFTNMVFAPPEARLVELIGPEFSNSAASMEYAGIAARSGQDFTRIVGRRDEQEPIAFDHLPYETYFIDPTEFESVLDR
jgi:capsular polysaccharide biosynthesis protein